MESQSIVKAFEGKKVRIQVLDGKAHFHAQDVCKVLDIANSRDAVSRIDSLSVVSTDGQNTRGQIRRMNYVTEAGVYELVFMSRKESAKKFQQWVYNEVLPSIRKTGKYEIPKHIAEKSTEYRKGLASEWARSGVKERYQYADLTRTSYKELGFEDAKRKKDFDEGELLTLMALESLETLNLRFNPADGYGECKESLIDTASIVKKVKQGKSHKLLKHASGEIQ